MSSPEDSRASAPYDHTPPHASSIIESLRAFGYDLPTALADLVDNSIAAGAKNVWVRFDWAGSDSVVAVTDDGRGMAASELIEAMRLGSRSPLAARAPHDLGRFGLGLKTASLSQCRRLTVRSRQQGGALETRCWDLDTIAATNDWRLLRDADAASEPAFGRLAALSHGTTVLWQQMDRLTRDQQTQNEKHHDRFLARIDGVRSHLGMVFHRLMTGRDAVHIFINERPLEPWDPFMENHEATHTLPSSPLRYNGTRVNVRAFVLPHFSKLTPAELKTGGGPRGWLAHQGFYIYRRDRLLVAGDWLSFGWTKDEHLKLARIAVELPNSLDHDWQIDVTKSRATTPLGLRDELKAIAEHARALAKNVYTHRGTRQVPHAASERVHLWESMAKHDRTFYQINRAHPLVRQALENSKDRAALHALLHLLQETIPLQHITIASAEKPDCQPQPFEGANEGQKREVMSELFRLFRSSGCSVEESRQRLRAHWPFELFPELIASLDDPTP
jgi:hypothetical protein